jgi:excisionase family DNA binding protein
MAIEPLWTAKEVAEYLKVSRSWVYQYTADGRLPCRHVGGLRRFDPAVVRAFGRGEVGAVVPLRRTVVGSG